MNSPHSHTHNRSAHPGRTIFAMVVVTVLITQAIFANAVAAEDSANPTCEEAIEMIDSEVGEALDAVQEALDEGILDAQELTTNYLEEELLPFLFGTLIDACSQFAPEEIPWWVQEFLDEPSYPAEKALDCMQEIGELDVEEEEFGEQIGHYGTCWADGMESRYGNLCDWIETHPEQDEDECMIVIEDPPGGDLIDSLIEDAEQQIKWMCDTPGVDCEIIDDATGQKEEQKEEATVVTSAGTKVLDSEAGGGEWNLQLLPSDTAQPDPIESVAGASGYEAFALLQVPIPDEGYASQSTSYSGPNQIIDEYEEPPDPAEVAAWAFACGGAATATYKFMKTAAPMAANVPFGTADYAAVSAAMIVGSALICHKAAQLAANLGLYQARGSYDVCWGCASSRWDGELLGAVGFASNGILEITSSIEITTPARNSLPIDTGPNPEGYYKNKESWNEQEFDQRHNAWDLHNSWMEILEGFASASIDISVPLIHDVHGEITGLTGHFIGGDETTGVWWIDGAVNSLLIGCYVSCGEDVLITISSDGTGNFSPGDEAVDVAFFGLEGEATLQVGPLILTGLTLDGAVDGAYDGGETEDILDEA